MLSFSTLSLLATIVCATFTSAAPIDIPDVGYLPTVADIPALPPSPVSGTLPARGVAGLPDILADVTAKITPLATQLHLLVAADISVECIEPITDQIIDIIRGAIADVKIIANDPVDTILFNAGRVITVAELASILAGILSLIFTALCAVFNVAGTAKSALVLPLLCNVGIVVGELLAAILLIVNGLLAALVPLLGSVLPIIRILGVTSILTLLGYA